MDYWLANDHLPASTRNIERVIFGTNYNYKEWRKHIRNSLKTTRESKKIRRKEAKQTVIPADSIFVGVPPKTYYFTGRDENIRNIDEVLRPVIVNPSKIIDRRVALHGLGGTGKSSLAARYLHNFRAEFDVVYWCAASSREILLSDMARLGALLETQTRADNDLEIAAKRTLDLLNNYAGRTLIVYDNVASPEIVIDLFPSKNVALIITSRFSDWSNFTSSILVSELSPDLADGLLKNLSFRLDDEESPRLAEVLGYLPLALCHAALTCRRLKMSFKSYLDAVESLIKLRPSGSDYPTSVFLSFTIAIEAIVSKIGSAEIIMAFLAYCAPDNIPVHLLNELVGRKDDQLQALLNLVEYSLVSISNSCGGAQTITVHRLVQAVARDRAQERFIGMGAIRFLYLSLNKSLATVPEYSDPQNWSKIEELLPHILAFHVHKVKYYQNFQCDGQCIFYLVIGEYLYLRGQFEVAEEFLKTSLDIYEIAIDNDQATFEKISQTLAINYQSQGRFDEALKILAVPVERRDRQSPDETTIALIKRANAAGVLLEQGNTPEAEKIYNEVFAQRSLLRANSAAFVNLLSGVYCIKFEKNYVEEARVLCDEALAICESELSSDKLLYADTLLNLGSIMERQGQYEQSRAHLENAVSIYEKILGDNHPKTSKSYDSLATTLISLGNIELADRFLNKSLAICEAVFGRRHRMTANVIHNLGFMHLEQGSFDIAESFLNKSHSIVEEKCGLGDKITFVSIQAMIDLQFRKGNLLEYERYVRKAWKSALATGNRDDPQLQIVYLNLLSILERNGLIEEINNCRIEYANFYDKLKLHLNAQSKKIILSHADRQLSAGWFPFALRLYRFLLDTQLDSENVDDGFKIVLMSRTAEVLAKLKDYTSAKSIYREMIAFVNSGAQVKELEIGSLFSCYGALLLELREFSNAHLFIKKAAPIYKRIYGLTSDLTGDVINNLGICRFELGDRESAFQLFEEARKIYEMSLGKNHLTTLTSRSKIAYVLVTIGSNEAAARVYEELLEDSSLALGELHPFVTTTLSDYIRELKKLGKPDEAERVQMTHDARSAT